MTIDQNDENTFDADLDASSDDELTAGLDDLPEDDGEADGEATFSLQSPEMAAKMQVMHENLPLRGQLEAAILRLQHH